MKITANCTITLTEEEIIEIIKKELESYDELSSYDFKRHAFITTNGKVETALTFFLTKTDDWKV